MPRKLILVVVDGLTPSLLEAALETGRVPTLAHLAEHGTLRRAVSTFPSLTPVCLSSIATGAHPDVHHIPHLVWYHRAEKRLVEYGSSFGAARAAGFGRSLQDAILNMNRRHLSRDAVTVFEALEDAGLVSAAVNFTCYRGRTPIGRPCPGCRRRTDHAASSTTASSSRMRRARRSRSGTARPGRSTTTQAGSAAGS